MHREDGATRRSGRSPQAPLLLSNLLREAQTFFLRSDERSEAPATPLLPATSLICRLVAEAQPAGFRCGLPHSDGRGDVILLESEPPNASRALRRGDREKLRSSFFCAIGSKGEANPTKLPAGHRHS